MVARDFYSRDFYSGNSFDCLVLPFTTLIPDSQNGSNRVGTSSSLVPQARQGGAQRVGLLLLPAAFTAEGARRVHGAGVLRVPQGAAQRHLLLPHEPRPRRSGMFGSSDAG